MRRTLEMTVIDGIKTSIPLHLKILADPDFIAGRLSTSFMERYMAEKKAGRAAGSPRPCSRSTRRCRAALYPILDVDLCRERGPRAASPSLACLARRRRAAPAAARQDRLVRGAFLASPTEVVARPRASGARRHRQRPRRHRAAGRRRRRARRPGRPAAARCARSSGRRRRRAVDARPRAGRRGAARRAADYIAVGPVFATATKDTGYDARGLDLVRRAARARQAGRRDRRHHARARAPGDRRRRRVGRGDLGSAGGGDPESRVRDYLARSDATVGGGPRLGRLRVRI